MWFVYVEWVKAHIISKPNAVKQLLSMFWKTWWINHSQKSKNGWIYCNRIHYWYLPVQIQLISIHFLYLYLSPFVLWILSADSLFPTECSATSHCISQLLLCWHSASVPLVYPNQSHGPQLSAVSIPAAKARRLQGALAATQSHTRTHIATAADLNSLHLRQLASLRLILCCVDVCWRASPAD